MTSSSPGPLLNLRAAVVFLLAFVIGVVAGLLSYLADRSLASAVLWGGGAAGGSLMLFHQLIG